MRRTVKDLDGFAAIDNFRVEGMVVIVIRVEAKECGRGLNPPAWVAALREDGLLLIHFEKRMKPFAILPYLALSPPRDFHSTEGIFGTRWSILFWLT